MLSVKQGGIKYHFLSLWYDLTWVSRWDIAAEVYEIRLFGLMAYQALMVI